jgi:hypothetical protein
MIEMKMTTTLKPLQFLLKTILFSVVLFAVSQTFAQSNKGKDFWLAETPKANAAPNADFAISIANSGSSIAHVTISNPKLAATISDVLSPGQLKTWNFSTENLNIQGTGIYTTNVYHVTSDELVVVYSFTSLVNITTNDAGVVLPTPTLGKKYFPGSYLNPAGNRTGSFFGVVATENTTNIKSYNRSGSIVDNVTINKGQYFQRNNGNAVANDVTGWYLESDKPVAVFSGSQCSAVGNTTFACDHLDEQVLPVETLASTYIASPTNARPLNCSNCVPDVFRYVATENGTVITTTPYVGGGTINKGQFIEIPTNVPHIVSGSNPFYGYQYLQSQNAYILANNGDTIRANIGDPSLFVMPLVEQFQYDYLFVVPSTFAYKSIGIVAPAGANLLLDGTPISVNWKTVGTINGVTYMAANYVVTEGSHKIEGDKRLGLTVTAFDNFASMAYLGGSGLEPINAGCMSGGPYQVLDCTNGPRTIQLNSKAGCTDKSTPTSIQWVSTNPNVVFSNPNIANPTVTVPGVGTYEIELAVTCASGTTRCGTQVIVREPLSGCSATPPPTIVPPPALVIPTDAGETFATLYNIGVATYTAIEQATLTNTGSGTYPIGTTVVTWTVTDAYGRSASGTQTITVVPPPTIVAPPAKLIPTDNGQNYATVTDLYSNGYWQYADNGGTYWVYNNQNIPTVSNAPASYQFPSNSVNSPTTTTVRWTTAADQWGRTASGTQDVIVVPAPTIVAPPDITITIPSGTATINDLGNATYWVYNNYSVPSNDGLASYSGGTTTVTWTVKDEFGRVATATQLVTVVVAAPPSVTPPPVKVVPTDNGQNYATVSNLYDAGYWIYGAGNTYFVFNDQTIPTSDAPASNQYPSNSVNSTTSTTVTWTTVADHWGRTASGTQEVIVVPPPTIVAPPAINVVIPSGTSTTISNLGSATYWVYSNGSPVNDGSGTYPVGSTTVTWSITDEFGRTATATQVVNVTVAPPPTITPPPAILVPTDNGNNYATVNNLYNAGYWVYGEGSGNTYFVYNNQSTPTSNAPASNQFPSNNVNSATTTTVTWATGSDQFGRIASGTQIITVVPPPTIVAPPDITVVITGGSANINSLGTPTWWVYNNYANATNDASGYYPPGTTKVTWSTKDQFGRSAFATQKINVIVAPAPSIAPPPAILVPTDNGQNYATVNNLYGAGYWVYNQATGTYYVYNNTAVPTSAGVPASNRFPSNGVNNTTTTTVTWTTGSDEFGRSASGTQTITVVPPPTIVAPASITVTIPYGSTSTTISNLGTATYWVYNNYSVPSNNGTGTYGVGTSSVIWSITDQFGRTVTGTQQIVVNVAPPVNGEVTGNQGCTPGFWKNWPQAWCTGKYTPATKFFSVFVVTNKQKVADITMMDAVDLNGGGYNALARHATAAVLDACHTGVAYPYTTAQIKSAVVSMFNTGTAVLGTKTYKSVDDLKNELERCNQLGCPLGQTNFASARGVVVTPDPRDYFTASVYPNPSSNVFMLQVRSSDANTSITIRVIDAFGRTVQVFNNITDARTIQFGEKLANGTYYAEVLQGDVRKVVPFVKAK